MGAVDISIPGRKDLPASRLQFKKSRALKKTQGNTMVSSKAIAVAALVALLAVSIPPTIYSAPAKGDGVPLLRATNATTIATEPTEAATNSTIATEPTEASTMESTEASTMESTEASTMNSTEASTMESTEASSMASTDASSMASTDASSMASTDGSTMESTEGSTMESTATSVSGSTSGAMPSLLPTSTLLLAIFSMAFHLLR